MADRFSTLVYLKMMKAESDTVSIEQLKKSHQTSMAFAKLRSSTETTLVQSEETTTSTNHPDRGFKAALQVFGSFLLFFNSWGTVNSFGVFQTYYQTTLLPAESPSNIAWLGSIQAALLSFSGIAAGPLFDAGHMRHLLAAGTVLLPLGMLLSSISTTWWHLLLSQGICVGLGAGCLFIPSVATVAQWYPDRDRSLAIGCAAAGSSLGGVVYPIAFRCVQVALGYAWAARTIALVELVTCTVALAVMRERVGHHSRNSGGGRGHDINDSGSGNASKKSRRRIALDLHAFREPPFAVYCAACFTSYFGLFGPQVYLQTYAIETPGVRMDPGLAFYLLPVLNAASTPGRILPGLLARRTGPINALIPSVAVTGALSLCWIGLDRSSPAGLFALAALYGFFSGAYIALPSAALAERTPNRGRLASRMGTSGLVSGCAGLLGTPVMGALLAATSNGNGNGYGYGYGNGTNPHRSYLGVQLASGLAMLLTAGLYVVIRTLLVGRRLAVRV